MSVPFENSETKINLMRAFAGESQARNRYTISASHAKKQGLQVVEAVFRFTADQEKEHAEIFYDYLKKVAGENIKIEGAYPVDLYDDTAQLLRAAQHNELEEWQDVYSSFGQIAREEGFNDISRSFLEIAKIEKTHADRFGHFAEMLERKELFIANAETKFMCLNCGYIYEGTQVPEICPVCKHDQGFFIRLELAPYTRA